MLDGVEGSRREYILDELSHNDRVRSAIMALPHDLQQEIKSFDSEAFHNRLKQQKEKAAADKDKKLNDAFIDLPADIQNKARLNAVARKSEKVGRVLTDAEANSVTISSEDINKALNDDYSASHVSD